MKPRTRRIVQALLFEAIALGVVGPALAYAFDRALSSTLALAVATSVVALVWNYGFNAVFERWEARQTVKGRSFKRRVVHGALFELGLASILIPMLAWWLDTTLLHALIADLGLMAFFFVYAIAFTWAFDTVFGLPSSTS